MIACTDLDYQRTMPDNGHNHYNCHIYYMGEEKRQDSTTWQIPLTDKQMNGVLNGIEKKGLTFFTPIQLQALRKIYPLDTPMRQILEDIKNGKTKI